VYRWIEHTGELEIEIESPSEEAVFADALSALGELLGEQPGGEPARHEVDLDASERATLLVEWLSELVFLAETEAFVPERIAGLELAASGVRAVVEGRRGNPRHLVKAVTYHRLEFRPDGDVWRARIVLDV
jgi:SHS2 domain-containing protein